MIEEAFLRYFRSNTELVSLLGSKEQIDIGSVNSSVKFPFITLEFSSGVRTKVSSVKMEQRSTIRVTVYGGPQHKLKAKLIAEKALRLLENYRGSLYDINDLHITCGSITGVPGLGDTVRYQFLGNMRFLEAYQEPST